MRVLLARAGALGDVLLLRPALWRLGSAGHAVTLLAPRRVAGLLVGQRAGLADALLDWEATGAAQLLAGSAPAEWRASLEACDLALALSRSDELRAALRRCVPRVLVHDPEPPPGVPAADWLCRPLEDFCPPAPAALPSLPVGPAPALAGLPAAGFLALHAGSGSPRKNWPAERFYAAAARLAPGQPWLCVRGPADEALPDPPAAAVVVRSAPLASLAALLSRARLFLGNDSGVSHLAAAVGAPTLALFGPTDARQWAPVGRRVRALQAPGGRLEELEVEAVAAEAERLAAT